jgi:hypothetical protein
VIIMNTATMFGMQHLQRSLTFAKTPPRQIADGIWLDRIQPGGRDGPNREVLASFPGGQVWTDSWALGHAQDSHMLLVPDIRLPANQLWPLHWHDCWIAVVILDGSCLIGDWWMEKGDVLISAAGVEYGPLVIGPSGCQMFEVFAKLHEHAGGYAPEYRDHPTLRGGVHVIKERSPLNRRNEGRSMLPCDGIDGLIKGHLTHGASWNLGPDDDPERGVMGYTGLGAGEEIAAHGYADWHGLFLLRGSLAMAGVTYEAGSVILAEPHARLNTIVAGPDGADILEMARIAAGAERQS